MFREISPDGFGGVLRCHRRPVGGEKQKSLCCNVRDNPSQITFDNDSNVCNTFIDQPSSQRGGGPVQGRVPLIGDREDYTRKYARGNPGDIADRTMPVASAEDKDMPASMRLSRKHQRLVALIQAHLEKETGFRVRISNVVERALCDLAASLHIDGGSERNTDDDYPHNPTE